MFIIITFAWWKLATTHLWAVAFVSGGKARSGWYDYSKFINGCTLFNNVCFWFQQCEDTDLSLWIVGVKIRMLKLIQWALVVSWLKPSVQPCSAMYIGFVCIVRVLIRCWAIESTLCSTWQWKTHPLASSPVGALPSTLRHSQLSYDLLRH